MNNKSNKGIRVRRTLFMNVMLSGGIEPPPLAALMVCIFSTTGISSYSRSSWPRCGPGVRGLLSRN